MISAEGPGGLLPGLLKVTSVRIASFLDQGEESGYLLEFLPGRVAQEGAEVRSISRASLVIARQELQSEEMAAPSDGDQLIWRDFGGGLRDTRGVCGG